jgi:hypothetical protein
MCDGMYCFQTEGKQKHQTVAQDATHRSGCKPRITSLAVHVLLSLLAFHMLVVGREEKLRTYVFKRVIYQEFIRFRCDFEMHHPIRISSLVSLVLHKYSHFRFSMPNPSKPHPMPTAVDIGLGRLPSGNPGAIFLASFPPPRRRRQ